MTEHNKITSESNSKSSENSYTKVNTKISEGKVFFEIQFYNKKKL